MFRVSRPESLPLPQALRRYWWASIGLAVFPALLFLSRSYGIAPEYLVVAFFAAFLLAMWPFLSGRAPFSFCVVMMAVWMGGILVAMLGALMVRGPT